jgi:hypothetical protein
MGSGALSKEAQTSNFVREERSARDMAFAGECCPTTGRPYEVGKGALTKTRQTENFKRI